MAENEEWTVEDRLQALKETREKCESLEREWKHWRNQSRILSLELIDVDRISAARVAQLSGHHRNTLKVWLDLYNAEKRAQKRRP
jgi:hypothetical protein